MALPKLLADSSPGLRNRFAGTLRKPVGGGVRFFDLKKQERESIKDKWERGRTIPLTVTNASQEMQPADNDRKFLYLVNNDPIGIVYVSFGGTGAALLQGVTLAAAGGGILLDNHVPTSKIHMIGTIANNPNVTAVIG